MSAFLDGIGLFFERAGAVVKDFNYVSDTLDILFVALLIYGLIRLIRETRGVQLLKGLFWVVAAWGAVNLLHMNASIYLFKQGFDNMVILLVLLFQPEIRGAFERVGRSSVTNFQLFPQKDKLQERRETAAAVRQVCEAFRRFSGERTGALVVFERVTRLGEIGKTGTAIEAKVSRELVGNIFFPKTPLHDGAAVVRKGVLKAAGCILPLSQSQDIDPALGTRHRAALGMSEQSDAMVAVVSEETGAISLADKGTLRRPLTPEELEAALLEGLLTQEPAKKKLDPRRWVWHKEG
ncbi:MAG: diadenylate cyclase CdaA [Firmicutes bacterium]|nr:diadenylate cyclase CdaA [Bacillota bacterium]